ncbi:MAG: hypothetical protein RL333_1486, partial [Pseudomonadota bacterium]
MGFRPFLFRLAQSHALAGWVLNQGGVVELHLEGDPLAQAAFLARLERECPHSARILKLEVSESRVEGLMGFRILQSHHAAGTLRVLPPDQAVCTDCLDEISDPQNRRYRYPFTQCT